MVIGYTTTTRPDANADFKTATTFVYYNDGKSELGSFAIQNRTPLTFEKIPETMKQAAVAAENRSFWTTRASQSAVWSVLPGRSPAAATSKVVRRSPSSTSRSST